MSEKQAWIDDVELEDVNVKWNWSHFDGRDAFSEDPSYNFVIVLPEKTALEMRDLGWTGVKQNEPYEEGDPDEWTLQIKISDKFGIPKMYLIKRERRFRIEDLRDLHDIRRDTTDQIDVIITPSRWVQGQRTGVTAYVKELYAKITESRFAEKYADYEEI